jgi:hypothetical protein
MSSPAISPKIRRSLAAALLAAAAGLAQAQVAERFGFATREQARAVLGAEDEYVKATAALERSAVMRSPRTLDPRRFAAEMAGTALAWDADETSALAAVLPRLDGFIAAMRWKAPRTILLVKASNRLMDGFPHTRGNAIVLQEGILREALKDTAMLEYLLAHEAFHVLSRADPDLREELYRAIGFQRCEAVEMPEALSRLRLTNPDAPQSRHTIAVRRQGEPLELLPFVYLPPKSDANDGIARMQTAWLAVERREGRCAVPEDGEAVSLQNLDGFYEQVGRNTSYVMHPEEILADNFAVLFRAPPKVPSPDVLERVRSMLQRR